MRDADAAAGVEVSGITKRYGSVCVLDDVSIDFRPGSLTCLLGPSGSGKTTLLRIVAGFVAADRGTVRFGGMDVTDEPVWRRRVGMVFQSYALFPHMSVRENVQYGLHRRGVRGAVAEREVRRALDLVQLIGFDARRPKQLSGGQQQRVALARAIVTNPRVLLLDEPLSALDRRLRQGMQVELRRIQRESGLTTIFVTHDQEEALTLADEIVILDGGRIVQRGTPSDVYERPRNRFAAGFLGDANFFTGPVTSGGVSVGGRLLRTHGALPTDGTMVTLAVRPERLSLAQADGAANRIDATLCHIVYAGPTSMALLVDVQGNKIKMLIQNNDIILPDIGSSVVLLWSPADTVMLSD